jgi:phospholipid/cholesterol/gamma-HCH transport system substrate-binding protein
VYDDKYADQLTGSLRETVASLQSITGHLQKSFEGGNGALPALMTDPEGKKKIFDLIDNLRTTSANLATFSATLQNGQGLVPRLLTDKQAGDQALTEFTGLVHQLNEAVTKLNSGQGTVGKMINDPSVYESINDILIGINESKLLRWLIRNRQEKGIETRVQTEQKTPAPITPPPPPVQPAATTIAKDGAPVTTTSPPKP